MRRRSSTSPPPASSVSPTFSVAASLAPCAHGQDEDPSKAIKAARVSLRPVAPSILGPKNLEKRGGLRCREAEAVKQKHVPVKTQVGRPRSYPHSPGCTLSDVLSPPRAYWTPPRPASRHAVALLIFNAPCSCHQVIRPVSESERRALAAVGVVLSSANDHGATASRATCHGAERTPR